LRGKAADDRQRLDLNKKEWKEQENGKKNN
jgi:hypothetical protein